MCDLSRKLTAWMDGELAENEAATVEQHVRDCADCRNRVEAYGEVSRLIVTYCNATATGGQASGRLPRWVPAVAGAVAVAALLLFVFRPTAVKPQPIVARAANHALVPVPEVVSVPGKVKVKPVHHMRRGVARTNPETDWAVADPAFQIVIPAEAMFAPGAVPEGTVFRANLSMASDGSVEGLRLLQ
jgi:hypothetical protein